MKVFGLSGGRFCRKTAKNRRSRSFLLFSTALRRSFAVDDAPLAVLPKSRMTVTFCFRSTPEVTSAEPEMALGAPQSGHISVNKCAFSQYFLKFSCMIVLIHVGMG